MKNRIWKQMKKAGIVTVLAGAMLGGTIEPKLTLGADFLPGQAPFIDQSVFWKDIESGQAELGIRIRGLNEWLSGRRFSEDKEKNEKWDDEFHKIEDPLVEQGRRDRSRSCQRKIGSRKRSQSRSCQRMIGSRKRSQSRSCRRMIGSRKRSQSRSCRRMTCSRKKSQNRNCRWIRLWKESE